MQRPVKSYTSMRIFTLALRALFLFCTVAGGCISPLLSQTFHLASDRQPVVSLNGPWRFHTGDDPAWAAPAYDDSRWSLLRPDGDWAAQGYRGYGGYAWYRFKLVIPAGEPDVALLLDAIPGNYEVYADSQRIGSFGKVRPNAPEKTPGIPLMCALPRPSPSANGAARSVTVAIRVWYVPSYSDFLWGNPQEGHSLAGDSPQLATQLHLLVAEQHWEHTGNEALTLLETLAALGGFGLFLLRRKDLEYLWFGITMFSSAMQGWAFEATISRPFDRRPFEFFVMATYVVCASSEVAFYRQLLRARAGWLFRIALVSLILELPFAIQVRLISGPVGETASWLITSLLDLPSVVWICLVFLVAITRKSKADGVRMDARLLILPVILSRLLNLFDEFAHTTYLLGWQSVTRNYDLSFEKPFPIQLTNLIEILWLLAVFAVLVLRFARTHSEQERYASEMEEARSVQQFLIPQQMPQVPGLVFESEYRPAREVGGDFFQIIPDALDGSTLIVVGDVAGKGLQAGMLATLIVGALRTAATFSVDPAMILHTLNNRLSGRGIATCLALRIDSLGAATLVGAGHLPPYLNGKQMPMEGALPLGTIPGIDFPVLHFQLAVGDSLTLISDGILEAQNAHGELFGFDRILKHLANDSTALSLASAAQDFGHSDDITVVTIARASATAI